MSVHRFIGGPHDGEWHNVQRDAGLFLPPIWTIAERPEVKLHLTAVSPEDCMSKRTDYVPLPLHVGKVEVVTFFIERGMTPEEAILRLAACYKPTSSAEQT